MSVLRSLYRLIDPIEHRRQAAEEKRKREALPPDFNPTEIEEPPARRPAKKGATYVCTVCGGVGDDEFCLECLSGTREPQS